MAEDYGVSLKITADTSDLDKVEQKVETIKDRVESTKSKSEVEVEEVRKPAAPVEHPDETVEVNEVRGTGVSPVQHEPETVEVREQREPAAPVEHPAETVPVTEQREPAAPVEHPAETVPVTEQREPAAPVEHPAETVEVNEVRGTGVSPVQHAPETVEVTEQREPAAPVEHPAETVPVTEQREPAAPVEHPAETVQVKTVVSPVVVPVRQDPDPLKINVNQPAPVNVQVNQPAPVNVPVNKPAPVNIEVKKPPVIKIETDDAEAKKRIADLANHPSVHHVRVVTDDGQLTTRREGREIFEIELRAEDEGFRNDLAQLQRLSPQTTVTVQADTSDALNKFNALRLVSATVTGNFAAAAAELAKLSPKLAAIGPAAVAAAGAAVYGIVSAFSSIKELISTAFNFSQPSADIKAMASTMASLASHAEAFAEAMDSERKAAESVNAALDKQAEALGNLTKAQIELNRQRELGAAKTDEDRNEINAKYDRQNANAQADTDKERIEIRRQGTADEISRLERELKEAEQNKSAFENMAKEARAKGMEAAQSGGTSFGSNWYSAVAGGSSKASSAQSLFDRAKEAEGKAWEEDDRIEELKRQLESKRNELKVIDTESKTVETTRDASVQKSQNDETKTKQDEQKKQDDDRKRQQAEQDRFDERMQRRDADADWQARFNEAGRRASNADRPGGGGEAARNEAENTQLDMLRTREDDAAARRKQAEDALAEEMRKEAKDRDEKKISNFRADIEQAAGEESSTREQRLSLESQIENRRQDRQQDYFGNLVQQIEAARPKDRLTAMGLGSGVAESPQARQQAQDIHAMLPLLRDILDATIANKPDNTAVYAP